MQMCVGFLCLAERKKQRTRTPSRAGFLVNAGVLQCQRRRGEIARMYQTHLEARAFSYG